MTQQRLPIYLDNRRSYHADSCEPLVESVAKGELEFSALARGTYPGKPLPKGVLPGLRSVGFWDAVDQQNWGLPWHRNEGVELTWLETGSLSFQLEKGEYFLNPGDLTITRPWQPHRLGNPHIGIGRLHWLILDVGVRQPHQDWRWPQWLVLSSADMADLTEYLRGNEDRVFHADKDTEQCFLKLSKAVASEDLGGQISRIAVYINDLFLHLLEMYRDQQVQVHDSLTTTHRSVSIFLESLPGNCGEEWTLEAMSEKCGLGVTSFVRYCRKITNQTPMQYLSTIRVERAAEMLLSDADKSVIEIAFECGFSSSQYFSTAFKRHFHCSPREYRKARERQR